MHHATCSDDIKILTGAVIATVAVVVTVRMTNDFYFNNATTQT